MIKRILVIDTDDGVIWARLEREIQTEEGQIEIYKMIEYYHSLKEALKDLYDIEDKE